MSILKKLLSLNCNSLDLFVKIFDSQIQPVLLYGAEIWGLDKAAFVCEKVHLLGLKRYLGVDVRTPNDLVYGETNRYPIVINCIVRCISYWLKLTRMEEHRFPRKAYKMLYDLDCKGKSNWVSSVRNKLCMYGYGFVWLNHGVENIGRFLRNFRERLVDCRWQEWNTHIQDSTRFDLYRQFSPDHEKKMYLSLNVNRHLKCIMTKFRIGVSDIVVHRNRYQNNLNADLSCPLCGAQKDDEIHVVLCCPALEDLRQKFIPGKYYRNPNMFRLVLLLSSRNVNIITNLCIYLYKAFQRRNRL